MTTTQKLTKTQREKLQWLAAEPKRYLICYGHQTKTVYALMNAGLVQRNPNEFQNFILTDAGREEAAAS